MAIKCILRPLIVIGDDMTINKNLDDSAVLGALGKRLEQRRLDLRLTQAAAAEQAGVSKRTIERMEAGSSVQLSSLLRVLRVLDLMAGLEQLAPPAGPRPMDLLQLKGRARQRAPAAAGEQKPSGSGWTWNDT